MKKIEEHFMMNLIDAFVKELPPLKEHLDYLNVKNKKRRVIPALLSETIIPYHCLYKEILFTDEDINKKTTPLCYISVR